MQVVEHVQVENFKWRRACRPHISRRLYLEHVVHSAIIESMTTVKASVWIRGTAYW